MALTARITFENGELRATLSDSHILFAPDPRELAGKLLAAGVCAEDTFCADWREGDIAPTAGQAIALKSAMRSDCLDLGSQA